MNLYIFGNYILVCLCIHKRETSRKQKVEKCVKKLNLSNKLYEGIYRVSRMWSQFFLYECHKGSNSLFYFYIIHICRYFLVTPTNDTLLSQQERHWQNLFASNIVCIVSITDRQCSSFVFSCNQIRWGESSAEKW